MRTIFNTCRRAEEHTSELQSTKEIYTLSLHDALPICALASATGQVQSVIKGKSSIGFSLKGDAHHFQYLSKSGELSIVYRALSGAEGEKVTVLFDPAQSGRPVFDDNDYHMTYEVGVSGRTLVSYERVRDAWQADKVAGNWLGMAFLLIGVALVVFSRLRQNGNLFTLL